MPVVQLTTVFGSHSPTVLYIHYKISGHSLTSLARYWPESMCVAELRLFPLVLKQELQATRLSGSIS